MTASPEPELFYLPYDEFLADVRKVAERIAADAWQPDYVVGIGRGGLVPAVYISHQLNTPMLSVDHSSKVPGFAEELLRKVAMRSASGVKLLFVDDINDSGRTIATIRRILTDHGGNADNWRFAVVINNASSQVEVDFWSRDIDRATDKRWFVFPWEAVGMTNTIVEEAQSVPARLA
ncbi:phosphoribosyltransferase family protein [Novosphingobium sp.]|jgi:hypoxanthine phosphoribosyltransferase|uniref:phosphoribosyltransferase n=1 Tax=Novosphingobium sp. TaxID=1874826 RepID=UPI0031D14501